METKEKPPCQYGRKCYRKNPQHFQNYSHPNELTKEESTRQLSKASNEAKKQKLDDHCASKDSVTKQQTKVKKTVSKLGKNEKTKKPNASRINKQERDLRNSSVKLQQTRIPNNNKFNCSKFGEMNRDENFIDNKATQSSPLKNVETDWTQDDLKGNSVKEIIKVLFLVDMPECFYSFFEFCKSIDDGNPGDALNCCGLKLVGPFDVLLGTMNLSINEDLALCHWRFYYDPPEFQTVLTSSSGFHIGYWRDDPNDPPVFLASNNSDKDCLFKMEAENIFGTMFQHLGNCIKSSDPFTKIKITKLQFSLCKWAEKHKFSLDKLTDKMAERQKKVVSKCFHKLGIVVPVEKITELGYRPLIETDVNLKKICKLIMNADDENERESLWENLQPLINAANIANDECDFGNSLELGIDLFCMGSPIFHGIVEHLLTTAYSLLKRTEFEKIIRAHLKNRKTGQDLSVN